MTSERKNTSVLWLIAANLIPLFGALFLSWDVFSIIFIYWAENIVIALYSVLKIIKAQKPVTKEDNITFNNKPVVGQPGLSVLFFFIVHYGMFTAIHGFFIFFLFYDGVLLLDAIIASVIGLFVSHGVSYQTNYIRRKEYERISRIQAMFSPYSRIVVLHLTIIASSFVLVRLGQPIYGIVIMVLIKISVDIALHIRQHKKVIKAV